MGLFYILFQFTNLFFVQAAQQRGRHDELQPEPAAAVQHGGVADAAAAERHGQPDPRQAEAADAAAEVYAQQTYRPSLTGSFFSIVPLLFLYDFGFRNHFGSCFDGCLVLTCFLLLHHLL